MMNKLVFTTACLAAIALGSQHQRYPGAQARINQDVFDAVKNPLFNETWGLIKYVEGLVPTTYDFGDLQITNVSFDAGNVDINNSAITIDNENSGIFVTLPMIHRHVVHIDFVYTVYYVIPIYFGIDIKLKDFQPQGGVSILADPVTGAPQLTVYNSYIDFGSSDLRFTDNVILKTIWFLVDWLKTPIFWILNWYMDTIANQIVQAFIQPLLQNGIIRIPTGNNNTVVLDFALPKNPLYNSRLLDGFVDGSIYFDEEGQRNPQPQWPLTFQESFNGNLQGVTTAFTANSFLDVVTASQLVSIPIPYNILENLIGITLTTSFFEKIIPQLTQTYGSKNLTIVLQPQRGTQVHWNKENEETQLLLTSFLKFYIVNNDTSEQLAFNALVNFDLNITIDIGDDKSVSINVEEMALTNFTIVEDHCNTKPDEVNIERRLNELMSTIQESINYLLPFLSPTLPTFDGFDYTVSLDYQDEGFGVAAKVVPN